jgi:hypothetical protein
MKTPLIASCAAASLLFAACEQKPAQISSASATPTASSEEAVREPYTPATSSSSFTAAIVTPETAPSPSANVTSKGELTFKTDAATQAASEYLSSYNTLLNDISATPSTRDTDPNTGLNNAIGNLQNLARGLNQLGNQQQQVQQQLTPDEIKRLLQYRKNLEKAASQNNSGL